MRLLSCLLVTTVLVVPACGSDDAPGGHVDSAIPGTSVLFDLQADTSSPEAFFDLPYPSDLRLTAAGTPEVSGFPNPKNVAMLENLRTVAARRKGFPMLSVAWFRFDGPLTARSSDDVIPADAASPILLVDVDESSPDRGKLIPTVAATIQPDLYVPENVLAVAPRPGFILRPGTRYAYVVRRALRDEAGQPLGVPSPMAELAAGSAPAGDRGTVAQSLYAPLWSTLAGLGVPSSDVAAATVFTTGDVVADLHQVSSAILEAYDVEVTGLHVDPDDGADHPRYCELLASVTYPRFQKGTPPFDTAGTFEYGSDGLPIKQADDVAPVTITLPKAPMPEGGYPIVLYFHGSGGLSSQIADRGTWHLETDPSKCPNGELDTWNGQTGCNTKGEGPAHVLAPHGFAMAASALPVNPERVPGAGETAYLNFNNLAALPYTFWQGAIEQRLFLEALSKLEIQPDVVQACSGLSLPPGETAYHFATRPVLAQGQSMGGMYTNMIGAVEPRIEAVVPTGAGGFWSYFVLQTSLIEDLSNKIAVLLWLPGVKLSFLHPAMHLVETAYEPSDPAVFVPRLARRPLPSHPVRSIYEPVGYGDSYFPTTVYDAMALSYGHPEAGDIVWPSMQQALALAGLDGIVPYDVTSNLTSETGIPYTGAVVQYEGDGVYDPHALYSQRDEVKYQYGCFFESFLKTGTATIFAPKPLGSACSGP